MKVLISYLIGQWGTVVMLMLRFIIMMLQSIMRNKCAIWAL